MSERGSGGAPTRIRVGKHVLAVYGAILNLPLMVVFFDTGGVGATALMAVALVPVGAVLGQSLWTAVDVDERGIHSPAWIRRFRPNHRLEPIEGFVVLRPLCFVQAALLLPDGRLEPIEQSLQRANDHGLAMVRAFVAAAERVAPLQRRTAPAQRAPVLPTEASAHTRRSHRILGWLLVAGTTLWLVRSGVNNEWTIPSAGGVVSVIGTSVLSVHIITWPAMLVRDRGLGARLWGRTQWYEWHEIRELRWLPQGGIAVLLRDERMKMIGAGMFAPSKARAAFDAALTHLAQ